MLSFYSLCDAANVQFFTIVLQLLFHCFSILLKIKFTHAQISVLKIGIKACSNPGVIRTLKKFFTVV